MQTRSRRLNRSMALVAALVIPLATAACAADNGTGDDGNGEWPTSDIRLVIASGAGGGIDTTTRQIQPYLEEQLGVNIVPENHGAGSGAVAGTLAAEDDSCNVILSWGIPHLIISYLIQDTAYDSYEDFYPIGRTAMDAGVIVVRNDAPWETMQEFIDDALQRPGELSMSRGSRQSAYYLGMLQLEAATGAEFHDAPFGGGSESRNAVVGGQADWTYAGVYNRLQVADDTRILAVIADENEWPELTNDAPPVNEALGTDLPPQGPTFGFFTSRQCHDGHPERHQILQDALEEAMQAPDFLATISDLGEEGRYPWMGADDYFSFIADVAAEVELYSDDLNED